MRLEDDPEAASWIGDFSGEPLDFDWDEGNRTKNRKHGVESEEVEDLFRERTVFVGRIAEPTHSEARWLLLGQNREGRWLALVFTRRGDKLRPISCRSMRKSERRIYEEALEGEEA